MPRLCDAAILDSNAHAVDEVLRCLIGCMDEVERDHYFFLQAASARLNYWLHHGADLLRGAATHPDWITLEWARASNASPEILRLLTPSVWPSLRPRAFCAGVELDMYVHVPGRIHRREVSQMSPRSRDHHLFFHAAGSLCKVKLGWIEELTCLMALPGSLSSPLSRGPRRLRGTRICFQC